jgi:hypothetical protein
MSYTPKLLSFFADVQKNLSVPKSQTSKNKNGAEMFKFRDYPQILTSLKPFLEKYGLLIFSKSRIEQIGDRYYVAAEIDITEVSGNGLISATGYAREGDFVGMNCAQSTGAAESYALKRAAAALFAIDDSTKDPDTTSEGKDWLTKIDDALWNAGVAFAKANTIEELKKINGQYAWLAEGGSKMYQQLGKRAKERILSNSNKK